jgi:pimeloyl-ACP methyl ester carboxylesterase
VARYVYYIHGFASSARSSKAEYFSGRLREQGVEFLCPDFNQPDFSTLTVSRMIGRVEQDLARLPSGPVALVGSSLGGLVAYHAAARQSQARRERRAESAPPARIDRLVLLAPALDFCRGDSGRFDQAMLEQWRATNSWEVFHHGDQVTRPIHFGLYEDAVQYDSFSVVVPVPALIFQGLADTVVSPDMVRRFSGPRPHVSLRLLADDHRLASSMDIIWQETRAFLGLALG